MVPSSIERANASQPLMRIVTFHKRSCLSSPCQPEGAATAGEKRGGHSDTKSSLVLHGAEGAPEERCLDSGECEAVEAKG